MLTVNMFDPVDYKGSRGNCMAVVLTGCHAKMYTGDGEFLQKLALVSPGFMADPVKNLLQHIDGMLGLFLHFYPVPVFIFGNAITTTYFKKITSHRENIIDFFTGYDGGLTEDAIKGVLRGSLKQANCADDFYHAPVLQPS